MKKTLKFLLFALVISSAAIAQTKNVQIIELNSQTFKPYLNHDKTKTYLYRGSC